MHLFGLESRKSRTPLVLLVTFRGSKNRTDDKSFAPVRLGGGLTDDLKEPMRVWHDGGGVGKRFFNAGLGWKADRLVLVKATRPGIS